MAEAFVYRIRANAQDGARRRWGWLLAALLAACGPFAPTQPAAVSRDPAAAALVEGMGLGDRLVDAEAARPGARIALALVPPGAPRPDDLPRDAAIVRVDRSRIDSVFAAARSIGRALDEEDAARAWVDSVRQGLAGISASSLGEARPHVGVVLESDPLMLAGGASLETELIEIAGAESVTHGGDELRIGFDRIPMEHRSPDLWLWIAETPPTRAEWARARVQLPGEAALEVFALPETWLADPIHHTARLRAQVAAIPKR